MPRPCKPRRIDHCPQAVHFKPQGIPLRQLQEVELGHDEVEALRLADLEGLPHEEVGSRMEVSRATAGRILASARRKVAQALVQGLAIRIETVPELEGSSDPEARSDIMPGRNGKGPQGEGPRTGRGLGRCKTDETGNSKDENTEETPGRGLGRGRGQGLGRGAGRGRAGRGGRGGRGGR